METVSLRSLCLFWPFFLVNLHLLYIPCCPGPSLQCISQLASKQTSGPPKGWKINPQSEVEGGSWGKGEEGKLGWEQRGAGDVSHTGGNSAS